MFEEDSKKGAAAFSNPLHSAAAQCSTAGVALSPFEDEMRATVSTDSPLSKNLTVSGQPSFDEQPVAKTTTLVTAALGTKVQSGLLPECEEAAQVQQDLREAFSGQGWDTDGDGTLDVEELHAIFKTYDIQVAEDKVRSLIEHAGSDGGLSHPEFCAWIGGSDPLASELSRMIFEEKLETIERSVGVFDKINTALSMIRLSAGNIKERPRMIKPRDELISRLGISGNADWDKVMPDGELWSLIAKSLSIELSDEDTQQLSKMGVASLNQFVEWWDVQSGIDTTTDPYQVALLHLEKSTMISPLSNFRSNWDLLQASLLMYIAIVLPYRLGFDDSVLLWSFWFFFDLAVDIYFMIDLFVNFRTAIITSDGDILYHPNDVARAYLLGWFPIDFTSCLPLSYLEYMQKDTESSMGNQNRAVRLLRLFRLLKLLRLVRIKRILERWEEEMYSNRGIRFAKLAVVIFVASHWACCGWFFAGDVGVVPGADGVSTVNGWASAKFNDTSVINKATMYFQSYLFAGMATLKMGVDDYDMQPDTMGEQVTYLVCFLMGTITSAIIIGQVSDMIAHANPGEKTRTDAIGLLHSFLHERQIPPWLTRRIRKHFSSLYTAQGTTLDIQNVVHLMPQNLAIELGVELGYLHNAKSGRRSIFCKVPFFCSLPPQDLIMIGAKLKPMRFMAAALTGGPIEYVMREGERADEMFIIAEGLVRIQRSKQRKGSDGKAQEPQNLGKLQMHDFFGELGVLGRDDYGRLFKRTRSAHVVSSVAILLTLKLADVDGLRQCSPTIENAVRSTVDNLRMQRPSLFSGSDSDENVTSLSPPSVSRMPPIAVTKREGPIQLQEVLDAVDRTRKELGGQLTALQADVGKLQKRVDSIDH